MVSVVHNLSLPLYDTISSWNKSNLDNLQPTRVSLKPPPLDRLPDEHHTGKQKTDCMIMSNWNCDYFPAGTLRFTLFFYSHPAICGLFYSVSSGIALMVTMGRYVCMVQRTVAMTISRSFWKPVQIISFVFPSLSSHLICCILVLIPTSVRIYSSLVVIFVLRLVTALFSLACASPQPRRLCMISTRYELLE